MNFNWIKTRQTRYTGYVLVYSLVIIAVLGAANWLANRHNKSFDATANKRFSLSDQTEKVVKGLNSDTTITYFDRTSEFTRARDLLDRYNNLSSRLKVDFVDPDKKPQIAKTLGVRNYGTIFVETHGRRQEAKSLTEEEVTGALIRALKGGERTACFVSGSGEHGLDDSGRDGYSSVKEALERNNYKTRAISLLEKAEVPKDCTVLVVAGPKYEYPEPVVSAIRTFVENGGRALLMVDPALRFGQDNVAPNPALAKVLSNWGVTLNNDLALDTSGIGQIFGLSEVVPLVASYESHAIVRDMRDVATAFPLSRTLEVKSGEKASAEKLFSTSSNSYATTNLSSPAIRLDTKKDKQGPFSLGAAGTYPAGDKGQGRFVVVGSSSWLGNNFVRFNGNRDLFLNMMNWLSSDEDLISIRPKDPEDRRLTLNRQQMRVLFYSSVVLLPLLVIVSGVAVWWRRR
jgi:ABC-type uncharacterized transport system involved in gliding motility auxiliary subunit